MSVSAFQETFGVPSFQEKFDKEKLLYLSKHLEQFSHLWDAGAGRGDTKQTGEIEWDPARIVQQYLKLSKGSDTVSVRYLKSRSAPCIHKTRVGRWFAESGVSLQTMPRPVRHSICQGIWIDLDFKNCHPEIALQLCQKHELPCSHLFRYVQERDAVNHLSICRRLKSGLIGN